MDIKRNGSQPSGKGPDEYFSGSERIDQADDPARSVDASGHEPGLAAFGRREFLLGAWP